MKFSWADVFEFTPKLLVGAWTTIEVSILAFVLALLLGLLFALGRLSRLAPLRWLATCYVQFIRGTPLLLQLFFIYYVLPYAGIVLKPFFAGVMGLSMNYSAYMAEVIRAGVVSIPRGQHEAALSLGMSEGLLMRRIILPQAFRVIVPPIGNFFVSIFKDSALVSIITMKDLMFTAELLAASTFKHFEIFTIVAVIYFLISYPTAALVERVEVWLDPDRREARVKRKAGAAA